MAGTRETPAQRRRREEAIDATSAETDPANPKPGTRRRARPAAKPVDGNPASLIKASKNGSVRAARGTTYGRRRRGGDGPSVMVASAARVDLGDRHSVAETKSRRQAWQTEAWEFFDEVGEIGYTVTFLGNLMSKLRLYPAVRPDPKEAPVAVDDKRSKVPPDVAKTAIETLDRLRSLQGGQSALIRDIAMNFEVTGECFIHGSEDRDTGEEDWVIRSVDELVVKGDEYVVLPAPGANAGQPVPNDDVIIRIWEHHPRFGQLATCAMRRVIGEAESLLLLSREVRATAKSRLSNGILCLPNELSFGSADPTRDNGDGEEGDDPFDDELEIAMTTPIQEEGAASAVVPLMLRGPAEQLKEVRHIILSRPLDPVLDARIEARVLRIARGLNMPVEVTTGLMATTYANAIQVKQSEYDDHIEPRAVLIADAVTAGYFQWALEEAGVDPDMARDIFVWFDPAAVVATPDQAEQAEAAHAAGIISDQARRRYAGFSEEDAPDALERLQRIVFHATRFDPTVLAELLVLTGLAPTLRIPAPPGGFLGDPTPAGLPAPGGGVPEIAGPDHPPGKVPPPDNKTGVKPGDVTEGDHPTPAEGKPGDPSGAGDGPGKPTKTAGPTKAAAPAKKATPTRTATPRKAVAASAAPPDQRWRACGPQLAAIDLHVRQRIRDTMDRSMLDALSRAGKRIQGKLGAGEPRNSAARIAAASPPVDVARMLGRPVVAALGAQMTDDRLLAGAFSQTVDDIGTWMVAAYHAAVAAVEKASGKRVSPDRRQQGVEQLARNVIAAQAMLTENLFRLASQRLYNPVPGTPARGETDGTVLIPMSLARAALAIAGGGNPIGGAMRSVTAASPGAWVDVSGPVSDASGAPLGGVGTGPDIIALAGEQGGGIDGYVWVYGPAVRKEFQGHADIDGTPFENFDDPVLAVQPEDGWLGVDFYMPGDHEGCCCDITPILLPAPESGDEPAPETPDIYDDGQGGYVNSEGQAVDESGQPLGPDGEPIIAEGDMAPAVLADALGYQAATSEVTPEMRAWAETQITSVRNEIKDQARAIVEDHRAVLDQAEMDKGELRRPPPPTWDSLTKEYVFKDGYDADWFQGLAEKERDRLGLGWFAAPGDPNTQGPDEFAMKLGPLFGIEGAPTGDLMLRWVDETRIIDAAQAIANGRGIDAVRYGGIDLNKIIESPYDLNQLFAKTNATRVDTKGLTEEEQKVVRTERAVAAKQSAKDAAAEEIARAATSQEANDAIQALGSVTSGTAPWEMTENEYVTELTDLETRAASIVPTSDDPEWGAEYSPADQAVYNRLNDLVPNGIDDPENPMSADQLYRTILKLARGGGLV